MFGESILNYSNEVFKGVEANAVFGGLEINLKDAIINENCVINVAVVCGGVDIILPDNVKVKVDVSPVFGGVDNKYRSSNDLYAITITIVGSCILGGIDIK